LFLKPTLLIFGNFNGCFELIPSMSFEMCVVKEISTKTAIKKSILDKIFASWITVSLSKLATFLFPVEEQKLSQISKI
jgi:hypothetical protein